MKSCLVAFLVVLFCINIEGTKNEKQGLKHTNTQNSISKKTESKLASTDNTERPAIGRFSLDVQKKSEHSKQKKPTEHKIKKSMHKATKLLREFKKCMRIYGAKHCKKRNNFKKAMIWPKKMLPALEKMLINKLNGNTDNGYDNYDNPNVGGGKNDFADNWDNVKPSNPPPPHPNMFNGMEVVPLLKMLKEKVGESSPYDSNSFTAGMPSNQGGSRYYTKMLLNQALGKPDRGTVMKDMMQEFYLANNNERSGQEAREAFSELMGHNNLMKTNSDMAAGNYDYNAGMAPQASDDSQVERMNMPDRIQNFAPQVGGGGGGGVGIQSFQGFGGVGGGGAGGVAFAGNTGGVLQAQELPNGRIAPVNQQMTRPNMQEMMPLTANPTTRMLGSTVKLSNGPLIGDQVMEDQMPTSVAAMHDSNSRPIFMPRNNDLVFEEQGENSARAIKSPSFTAGNPYFAGNAMSLGANYKTSRIPESNLAAANGGFEIQGNKFASFSPDFRTIPQEIIPSRRDNLPANRKHHKPTKKAPMRSKHLHTRSNDKSFKKAKKSTKKC